MKRPSKAVRMVVALVVLGGLGAASYALINPREGHGPLQPIHFRHVRMAGKPNWVKDDAGKDVNLGGFNIPCIYCHTMPYKGRHSTLPSTDICMNCHTVVGQDREWVIALKQYWDAGQPIPWVKVHDLPDFVYYDHSAHLNARNDKGEPKVACADCHGTVEEMEVVTVQHAFNMGWCLDCHRKPEMAASTDCFVCHR